MWGLTLRSSSARLIASRTIGSLSKLATISTDSPGSRMPMPAPWNPERFRASVRAAGINSSMPFGGLKYDGHRGAGYLSLSAAADEALAAPLAVPAPSG